MMFEEALRCERGKDLVCARCECRRERLAHGPHEERCTPKHTIPESTEAKEIKDVAAGIYCRRCVGGSVDERDNGIASYVRMRLKTMASDDFSVSRYTADCAARALQDRFFSDTDAVLKRVLDLAALRYLRDGSTTVTQEDVTGALRLLLVEASRP